MDKNEIIARLERIARCAIHTVGEPPFIMSLDDGIAVHEAIDIIQRPQPIDAVPVVRCKDCKHWDEHSQYGYDSENGVYGNYCMLWTPDDDFYAVETPEDGFCYNGERKTDE